MKNSPIALITDFGLKDGYVGVMKGVVLKINPDARIIDITHEIKPQSILEASFVLSNSYFHFPDGTIFLVVVDPGVGSGRRAICVRTKNFYFIAPDNGVLTPVFEREKKFEIRRLTNEKLFLPTQSRTFHGRDIFSPVAAHLSLAAHFDLLGPIISNPVHFNLPKPRKQSSMLIGEVVHVDHFGNAITNISKKNFRKTPQKIIINQKLSVTHKKFYAECASGALSAVFGSNDLLEIIVKNQSAEKLFRIKIGDKIKVCLE